MDAIKLNVEQDFKVFITLPDAATNGTFVITLFAGGAKYSAEYDGSTYKNCRRINDSTVVVLVDNHHLKCGEVVAELKIFIPDETMPDNNFKFVTRKAVTINDDGVEKTLLLHHGESESLELASVTFELLELAMFYGFYETANALPTPSRSGYAYVGSINSYDVYATQGKTWKNTGVKANSIAEDVANSIADALAAAEAANTAATNATGAAVAATAAAGAANVAKSQAEEAAAAAVAAQAKQTEITEWAEETASDFRELSEQMGTIAESADLATNLANAAAAAANAAADAANAKANELGLSSTNMYALDAQVGRIFETLGTADISDIGDSVKEAINNESEKLSELEGKVDKMVSITYAQLKAKRDASQLVAGTWYRITDYQCTTTQEDTQSANHPFDILVLATSTNTLNENARAIKHVGDTYFAECNLDAWVLKYSIDNDTTRFAWADDENGKGVIYLMVDEWNNECPYDFKNIMFKRNVSLEEGFPKLDDENGDETFVYTFCANSYHIDNDEWSALKDGSLESPCGHESDDSTSTFHDNIIKEYRIFIDIDDEDYTKCGRQYLNNIVMFGYWEEKGSVESVEEYPYYYAYCCYSNTFGIGCYSNTFGINCYSNTFESSCYSNTFGIGCYSNTFGIGCYSNTFESSCYSNTFGNSCRYNTFGNSCSSNTFGNSFSSNTFGNSCRYNTFGNDCSYNTFGNDCSYNTFGNYCSSNTFGNDCSYNTFGNSVQINSYYRFVTLENGVKYTNLYSTYSTSSSSYAQNIHVNSGVKGSSNTSKKTLSITATNNAYLITFGSANDKKIDV